MGIFLHLNEPDFADGATVESASVAPAAAWQTNVKELDLRIAKGLDARRARLATVAPTADAPPKR